MLPSEYVIPLCAAIFLLSTSILGNANCQLFKSGLYVDNGRDRTIAHLVDSLSDKRQFARDMLRNLGLPAQKLSSSSSSSMDFKRSSSRYLYRIYDSLLSENHHTLTNSNEVSPTDANNVLNSDVIVTYPPVRIVSETHGTSSSTSLLTFDFTESTTRVHSGEETLINAQLRLYVEASKLDYEIWVENCGRRDFHESASNDLQCERRIGSRKIDAGYKGWVGLDVTWVLSELSLAEESFGRSVMRVTSNNPAGFGAKVDQDPFVVAYLASAANAAKRRTTGRRSKRSSDNELPQYSLEPRNVTMNQEQLFRHRRQISEACKLHSLYVSFKDLGYDNFIIRPHGYDANYCCGKCNFPLAAHANASNHAIVQTLVHLLNPQVAPKALCAPSQLAHLPVIYSQDGVFILKTYHNIIVRSCGCF